MAIRRWEPFGELASMRDMMERMFEEFPRLAPWSGFTSLPIDMYQTDKELVVKTSIPGVKPEDIDISVVGDTLTIKGERKAEEETKRENYFYRERSYGTFSRSVTLPVPVEADKAEAKFEHGVLTLTLPKAETAKAKKIPIRGQ